MQPTDSNQSEDKDLVLGPHLMNIRYTLTNFVKASINGKLSLCK